MGSTGCMKKFLASIICIAMLISACGCSSKSSSSVKLVFYTWCKPDSHMYDDIAQAYMKDNANVTIEFKQYEYSGSFDSSKYLASLIEEIEAGTADMFMLPPELSREIYDSGYVGSQIMDLSSSKLMDSYSASIKYIMMKNGQICGCPTSLSAVGILANKALLLECGVSEVPKTYSAWVSSMELVKQAGYTQYVSFNGSSSDSLRSSDILAGAMVGAEQVYGRDSKQTSPLELFTPMFERFSAIVDKGLITADKSADSRDCEKALELFAKGETAYVICSTDAYPVIDKADTNFSYKFMAIPASDSGGVMNIGVKQLVGISGLTEKTEAAEAFMAYVLRSSNISKIIKDDGGVSPLAGETSENKMYKPVLAGISSGEVYSDTFNSFAFDESAVLKDLTEEILYKASIDTLKSRFNELTRWW